MSLRGKILDGSTVMEIPRNSTFFPSAPNANQYSSGYSESQSTGGSMAAITVEDLRERAFDKSGRVGYI
jgi:hypothetical protein